jgi:hypothetical protein
MNSRQEHLCQHARLNAGRAIPKIEEHSFEKQKLP